jgi:type I restriction enzyme, R subunit
LTQRDVLRNYTTFKRYFKLVKSVEGDKEYERKKAIRLLTSYVDLKPHAFDLKTRIILDHFMAVTMKAIEGKGRAMLVTKSRLHAVRFQLAFQKVLGEMGLPFKSLVAFSGIVIDPDSGASYTETAMNSLPPKVTIQDALKTPEYRILIAANKFQTGFDEPMLHTMYVDKKLGGVGAVQTLSRLNRTARGKVDTVILDFVNEWEEIQKAFQDYYQVTYLEEETDPNKLYTLKTQLEQFEVYTRQQVKDFAKIFFNPKEQAEKLQPILDEVALVFGKLEENKQEDFRSMLQNYIRFYGFVSQLVTFKDTDLEQLYVFAKSLNRKLPKRTNQLPYEIQDCVDLDSFRIRETFSGYIPLTKQNGQVKPIGTETRGTYKEEFDFLSHIIKTLNDAYGANLTDDDKVDIQGMQAKIEAHEELRTVMNSDNTEVNIRYKFEKVMDEILLDFVNTKLELYKKLSDAQINTMLKKRWFEDYYRQRRAI